ncbi:Ubiquinol-cytochrome-c reductase complex assembly factor 2, partial [Lamellibrachia satsuma]
AVSRYRKFLRLCEEWPLDKTKTGRDLGAFIRKQVADAFNKGESSNIDPQQCDRVYESLMKVKTNYYKNMYSRAPEKGCSGLSAEECNVMVSSE